MTARNSFGAAGTLSVGDRSYRIHRLSALQSTADLGKTPYSIKLLLENLLRHEDGVSVHAGDIEALARFTTDGGGREIAYSPARILLQDFTGVPCVVDLAAMRDAVEELGGAAGQINPVIPVDLVIDHSVVADVYGRRDALEVNTALEFTRNAERYRFLRWGQQAFSNMRVVPPGTGICHQFNLEYLSSVVFTDAEGAAYPDTVVGTDSHTPMVNGLGVLAWGVGGIEAEAAMLGQPISMLVPPVVGLRLTGELPEGTTATDLVLTVAQLLRSHGVVGKFVECYGPGVAQVPLENRATIGNMSPEYGSTVTIFPIDAETLRYLRLTGRPDEVCALVEAYAKEQGLWHDETAEPSYSERIELDLSTIEPSIAGPSRPQDRVPLRRSKAMFADALVRSLPDGAAAAGADPSAARAEVHLADGTEFSLEHGHVLIAAITSCTNTSNPQVMIGAGLVAKRAVELGLSSKPWVKTTLAPGSRVVMDYLGRAGLVPYLEKLGFDLVGFGCTTCIGNSGPLLPEISLAVNEHGLAGAAVLSGNRNFEGRIHPDVRMNYLASPPLVVVYALAGTMNIDLGTEALGVSGGRPPGDAGGHLALQPRGGTGPRASGRGRDVPARVRGRHLGRQDLAGARDPGRAALRVGRVDLRAQTAVPRRDEGGTRAARRHIGGEGTGPSRRQRHDRPHLPRGIHPPLQPGRPVAAGQRGRHRRLQLLRSPARQPRGHDPGNFRERPHPQPPRVRRGRSDAPSPRRRADDDLRRRGPLPVRGRAARRHRRQGVRFRLLA